MTTLTFTARTAKGQTFPVVVTVSEMSTSVLVSGTSDCWLEVVKGTPALMLSSTAAKLLLGVSLPSGKGALQLDRNYTQELQATQQAEAATVPALQAARKAAFAAANPEYLTAQAISAHVYAVMQQD